MATGRFAAAAHRRFWNAPILARCRRTSHAAPRLNRILVAQRVRDEHQERMGRWCALGRARVPFARMTRTADCAAAWPLTRPRQVQVLARTACHLARDNAPR